MSQVWDACGAGYITFNADAVRAGNENVDDNSMAFIIENSVILSALAQKIQDIKQNVHMMYNSKINDINFPDGKVTGFFIL